MPAASPLALPRAPCIMNHSRSGDGSRFQLILGTTFLAVARAGLIFACLAGTDMSAMAQETPPAAARKLDFSRDIRPILANHCWSCHGPDEKHRKAALRLDLADGSRAKLESGFAAIVPGKSGESELVTRIE